MRRIIPPLGATLVASFLLLASPAQAEADAETFLTRITEGGSVYRDVLHAYAVGFLWANTNLSKKGLPRMFCAPDRLAITAQQDVDILRRFAAEEPSAAKAPAGLALMLAYERTFPCPNKPVEKPE